MIIKIGGLVLWTSTSVLYVLGSLSYNFNPINSYTDCGAESSKFLSFLHISIERCILECGRRSRCKALNYRLYSSNYCELLETLDVTTGVADCLYLTRSDIDFENQLFNACGCALTESCDVGTGICSKTEDHGKSDQHHGKIMEISWNFVKEECIPIRTVANGHIRGNKFEFGNSLRVVCDTDYEATNGAATVTCLTTGDWDNTPACQKLCNAPVALPNGQYLGSDYSQGAILNVTCDPDYREINDVTSITCLNDGTWNEAPLCVLKECGDPPIFSNGVVTGFDRTIGSVLPITCNTGYREFIDILVVTCLTSQLWDYTPQCVLKECGNPPSIEYGSTSTASVYTVGTILTVTCNFGYSEANGLTEITCSSSAIWDNTPSCQLITCDDTININYGSIYYGTYGVGQSATVFCDTNYVEQSGLTEIVCMATGNWDYIPNCVIQECGNPPSIEYGSISTASVYTVGTILTVTCNFGYSEANGLTEITCSSSAIWDNTPSCQLITCDDTININYGSIYYGTYGVGQSATVFCDTNYVEQSGLTEIVCMATGNWDYIPNCVIQECPTPSIPNGGVSGSDYTVGSILNIQCNAGYASNNQEITCVSSQTWLPSAECTQVMSCTSPWFEADGSCFYVTTSSIPEQKFDYAESYCANDLGGKGLARLDTETKYNAVKAVLNGYSNTMNNYWIGAKRTASNHNMKWIDNNDDVGYHNYASGEPGTNSEHCAFLWKNDGWQWHNGMCSWSDRFVCEKNMN